MELTGGRFVLIGGGGLIGSHTAARLIEERPAEILIFGRTGRPIAADLVRRADELGVKLSVAAGDVTRRDALSGAIAGADGVFHLAAMWMAHCHEAPRDAFDVNVAGTFNVMEACAAAGVKRLVFSSTRSVYGDASGRISEDEPLLADNLYGASKIAAEAMLTAFEHRYRLSSAALRYFNVYGPGQEFRGPYVSVIHKMLNAIEEGDGPMVFGDGSETFDFVAVEDCAEANIAAMKSSAIGAFNVGTGVGTSLKALAELLIDLTGFAGGLRYKPASHASAVRSSVANPDRARQILGFETRISLREGLGRLLAWRQRQMLENATT